MSDIMRVDELLAVLCRKEEIPRYEKWELLSAPQIVNSSATITDCETHTLAVTKLLHCYLFQASFSIERCRILDKTKPKSRVEG
jgi:hypothetical protein